MKLEVINNIRVLTPSEGMLLCNTTDKVLSDKVYLGKNADESTWIEVPLSDRERLEAEWYGEESTE